MVEYNQEYFENQMQADAEQHYMRMFGNKEEVDHPEHYQGNDLEAIDVIENFKLNFHMGNAVKYILRAGRKGDKTLDLKKAIWYLQREIEISKP